MSNTCIGHCKVPELHWHMRNRGYHGNVCLGSHNADCSVSDAIGMFVTMCSVFKSVSVSVSGAKRSKFLGPIIGLWVMPNEAINLTGIVVPLGGQVEESTNAGREFRGGAVLGVNRIVLSRREVGEDVSITVVMKGWSRVGTGIQGELLADEGSCFSVNATIVCGCLTHCAVRTSRTDWTGGMCIFGGEACIEGMIAVPCHGL